MANNLHVHEGATSDPLLRTIDTGSGHLPVNVVGQHQRSYDGSQSLTLTGSSQALTVPAGATFADVYCEGDLTTSYARFWDGGSTPTATVGKRLKDHELWETGSPATFKALNGSGACTLRVEYWHYA